MSKKSPIARLDRFLEQSRELVQLAEKTDWANFEARLKAREQGLPALVDDQFVAEVTQAGLVDEAKTRLAEIQQLNDQITHLAEQGKAALSEQLSQMQKGDKAVRAYTKNT